MSANQYAAASSQLLARNEQRRTLAVEEYLFNKQQDEAAFDYANTAIAGMLDIDKSKKEVMRHLGVSKEEEVPAAMEAHRQKYGAAALGRLAEFIAITTGVGQGG